MYKLASSLASKVGLAKNCVRPVALRFITSVTAKSSCRNKINPFKEFGYNGSPLLGEHNPACNVVDYDQWGSLTTDYRVYKYVSAMTQTLCAEENAAIFAKADLSRLNYGIFMACMIVIDMLQLNVSRVSSYEQLIQVATVAANGDRMIGELVSKAIKKVGPKAAFIISEKIKSNNELIFDNGLRLEWGLVSPMFNNNMDNKTYVLRNPYILIHKNKILSSQIYDAVLSSNIRFNKRPLLVIAEDIEMKEMASIVLDWRYFGLKVYVTKPLENKGYTAGDANAIMQDLAILTGGQVIDEEFDFDIGRPNNSVVTQQIFGSCKEVVTQQIFGSCKEVRASSDSVVILGGSGSNSDIKERCEQLRSVTELCASDDEKYLLEERFEKLSRGGAVFKVRGDNKAKIRKKNKIVRTALEAAKAAMRWGVIAGGGAALLHISNVFHGLKLEDSSQMLGFQLVQHALKMPVYSIATNAGFDGLDVVNELLKQKNWNIGFDPITGEYVDMVKAGNLDPWRPIRSELTSIARYFTDENYEGCFVGLDLEEQKQMI